MNIQQMTLMNNYINDDGALALADSIYSEFCKLQRLDLRMNFIKDTGAAYFVDGFFHSSGGYLNL